MAMLEVACPGCSAKLKAPDTSAGKKAQCKKCGTSFRLPGPAASTAGDAQMLSAVDVPAAEPNPFALDSLLAPPPPPPAPPKKPEPAAKPPAPQAKPAGSDDPFNFGSIDEPTPLPPPPAAKKAIPKAAPPPEPKPKPKVKPKPERAPRLDPFDDDSAPPPPPASEILSLDDDPPPPPASGDPFAFSEAPASAPRSRNDSLPTLEDDEPHHTYHRRPQKSKAPLIAVLLGLVALGAVIAVVVVVMNKKSDEPQAKTKVEPKDEKKEPDTQPAESKDDANKDDKKDTTAAGKGSGKAKTPTGKKGAARTPAGTTTVPAPAVNGQPGGNLLALENGVRTIQFNMPKDKEPPVKAESRRPIALEVGAIRRLFPPHDKVNADTVFVVKVSAGFQGQGEKFGLERYSPGGMRRADKLEFPGDGQEVPACDVTPDTDQFVYASGGKLTAWKLADKSKLVDEWDVFAEMPEHKKAGIAAVYFVTPNSVATVTTAGAVHAWDLSSKKMLGEYIPVKGAPPGKVAEGKSVTRTADRAVVVVAVGGAIHQVGVKGTVGQAEGQVVVGEVGRSLGLAISGNGKLLYAFETAPGARTDGKKEIAVAAIPSGGRDLRVLKWSDAQGEPKSAGWANEDIAVVGTQKGRAVWFELSEGRFSTLALLTPPGEVGLHATGEAQHWAVLPDPALPGNSVLLEYQMPPDGILELQNQTSRGQPAPTLALDPKGGGA